MNEEQGSAVETTLLGDGTLAPKQSWQESIYDDRRQRFRTGAWDPSDELNLYEQALTQF